MNHLDHESVRILQEAAASAYRNTQAHVNDMNLPDAHQVRSMLEDAAKDALLRVQEFEIPRGVPPGVQERARAAEEAVMGLWPIVKRGFFFWMVGTIIVISSIATYGMFYLAVQPGQVASESIYFDYSGIARHPSPVFCESENEKECRLPMMTAYDFEATQTPWAVADFFSHESQWEAYYDTVHPKPRTSERILRERKAYFFEVSLELPESPVNRDTGLFMVQVDLQSSNGTRLATSIRPSRLPHESHWISNIRKSLWLVPLMIGATQETRRVVVPSFRHFVESPDLPLRFATITLIMQNKDKPHRPDPLEVMKGEISIGKELSWFQFLLREWFFTCYLIGTLVLVVVQAVAVVMAYLFYEFQRQQREMEELRMAEEASEGLNLDINQLDSDDNGEWSAIRAPDDRVAEEAENLATEMAADASTTEAGPSEETPEEHPAT